MWCVWSCGDSCVLLCCGEKLEQWPVQLSLSVCVQELRAALSVHVGEITSHARSVRSGSVPASRPSGSVTEITTVETTATRMDAVSSRSFIVVVVVSVFLSSCVFSFLFVTDAPWTNQWKISPKRHKKKLEYLPIWPRLRNYLYTTRRSKWISYSMVWRAWLIGSFIDPQLGRCLTFLLM